MLHLDTTRRCLRGYPLRQPRRQGRPRLCAFLTSHQHADLVMPSLLHRARLADELWSEQRASIAQGKGFLAAVGAAFAHVAVLAKDIKVADGLCGHLAPIFGIVCRALGLSLDEARRLFLFIALRSLLSAAVRSDCFHGCLAC